VGRSAGLSGIGERNAQIVRQLPIELKSDILECIRDIGNVQGVQCVGYKGESINRIDLLVA
jgi:hypothetical protein